MLERTIIGVKEELIGEGLRKLVGLISGCLGLGVITGVTVGYVIGEL